MVVLADEGIVLVAYLLFVYGNNGFDGDDLAEFAAIAPLPDRIVHVKAPIDSLVRRTRSRADAPRELRTADRESITYFLNRAADMFGRLVMTRPLRDRVLEVDNLDGTATQQALAARIADFILDRRQPVDQPIPTVVGRSHKEV
jgi:hypothetical protein